jgi:hypothetical protein
MRLLALIGTIFALTTINHFYPAWGMWGASVVIGVLWPRRGV